MNLRKDALPLPFERDLESICISPEFHLNSICTPNELLLKLSWISIETQLDFKSVARARKLRTGFPKGRPVK